MMLCRKPLQSHLRPLSVLVFHLLLTHFCRGQSQLIGQSQPIVATLGDDIILPCHLEPAEDASDLTLEWMRPDLNPRFVHVLRSGQVLVGKQHKSFEGRTSLFTDELKIGNISLKLNEVKLTDQGTYRCFILARGLPSFVRLVVGAVGSPVTTLAGIDRSSSGVILNCESAGWYPEPEVVWLDGEGNLLPAGPTETVRGPDDLYTVSSRVTVEKRHNNSFTCRVQQKSINQTREAHIHVPDDFFEVQSSSSSVLIITGLAVSLAACILLILLLVFVVWKWRQNIIKTKRSQSDETDKREKKNSETADQLFTEEERERQQLMTHEKVPMKVLKKGKKEKKNKHVDTLMADYNKKLTEEKQKSENERQLLQTELDTKKKEWEKQLQEEKTRREEAEEEVKRLKEELETKLEEKQAADTEWTKTKDLKEAHRQLETKNAEIIQFKTDWVKLIQLHQQREEKAEKHLEELLNKNMEWEKQLQEEKTRREEAEEEVKRLKAELETKLEAGRMLELENPQKKSPETHLTSRDSIIVDVVDKWGRYVRLRNQSNENQPMRGWEMHVRVNSRKPVIYTFTDSFTLWPRKTVNIWAAGCGYRHDSSTDLVWWSQKSWGTGDHLQVTLFSNTGELEAGNMLELRNQQNKGPITVDQVDLKGCYVRLRNQSYQQQQQLGGWEMHVRVNSRKPVIYTFNSFTLRPGRTVTIWSSDHNTRHDPPTDLVWQGLKSWGTGDHLQVTLFSNTGEEMATRTVDNNQDDL